MLKNKNVKILKIVPVDFGCVRQTMTIATIIEMIAHRTKNNILVQCFSLYDFHILLLKKSEKIESDD